MPLVSCQPSCSEFSIISQGHTSQHCSAGIRRLTKIKCYYAALLCLLSYVLCLMVLTVSDSYLKLVCLLSTSAYSALEVLHIMRYI